MTIRTLVLSGGGGRGAFHVGVYKYLSETNKPGVDAEHSGAWQPDIVVGTSIGAVNGAAIVQGISADELERFWLSLRENDIQGLPPGMGWLARRVANMLLRQAIGTPLKHMSAASALSPTADESWPPIPLLPRALSERLIGRWSNLLDTGPLYQTLQTRLGLDEAKIAEAERLLLISATNVQTGEGVIFSNRSVNDPATRQQRRDLRAKITLKRIIASCSIPMVYPWTKDEEDGAVYWDGAVVANTPLGPAFDAISSRPIEEPMETVVVMMTPWWESSDPAPQRSRLPQDFGEAATWTLDWALLASFRADLKLTATFNKLAQAQIAAGETPEYRICDNVIVAPEQFLPVERIIDYDEPASRALIESGYNAAKRAFEQKFPAT